MLESLLLSLAGVLKLDIFFKEYRYFGAEGESRNILETVYQILFILGIVVVGVFLLPVVILLYHQVTNLFLNLTTFERFSTDKARRSRHTSGTNVSLLESENIELHVTSSSHCSFSNCGTMCCGNEE